MLDNPIVDKYSRDAYDVPNDSSSFLNVISIDNIYETATDTMYIGADGNASRRSDPNRESDSTVRLEKPVLHFRYDASFVTRSGITPSHVLNERRP